ncbi:gelsolin-like protein 2 [Pecten maximus]|uniref:gelsolin-like protein 2 n=1 Tax=Pecten maximus TaxID=6579 RepID=UPI0014590107|nr:gelsolin-like protein 2 [Pecten maximus]XP_033746055.1 gelsolin-like protein 2 [Pecten maximus]XP_033746056.1 gelsolin-like protein 2 [Pecten maximus]
MSGLIKAKKYDWKDSNMALFGTDTDRQVKKESAETEPAWEGAGQEVGLKIWRINKFRVEPVDEEDYGDFYKGDSYIVLNTYQKPDTEELLYDVHFWIGEDSTQDEYGTAAYKTVELDTFLDDRAIQHREVQKGESKLFLSYFSNFVVMSGGYASGFRHVEPIEYKPRLFCIQCKDRSTVAFEVKFCKNSITSDDIFIFDSGSQLVQLNGAGANLREKSKAMDVMSKFVERRPKSEKIVADEGDRDYERCCNSLRDEDEEEEGSEDVDMSPIETPVLSKVTDADGSLGIENVKTGDISMDDFDSNDVFLLHVNSTCYVWVGSGASIDEKKNGMYYANKYLKQADKPFHGITVFSESSENNAKIMEELAA